MGDQETDQIQNTEITLNTGKLLAIFFGLALVCGLFFTMGYMLGHNSAVGGKTEIVGSTPTGGSSAGKPSAANKSGASQNPVTSGTPALSQTPTPPTSVATPTPAAAAASGTGGTFMVQVAAVSKQEDAEILVTALHKKQYPVFIANVPGDALYHVQVGPFTDQKDADAMRQRLSADGYNAIVKK
jgi:DedD protein